MHPILDYNNGDTVSRYDYDEGIAIAIVTTVFILAIFYVLWRAAS